MQKPESPDGFKEGISFELLQGMNDQSHDLGQDALMAKNTEQTLIALEDSFWYLLNNPLCYCDLIFKFFNKNNLFCMFPYVENFFQQERNNLVIERALENANTENKTQEIDRKTLEEIKEDLEEYKNGKFFIANSANPFTYV